MKSIVVYYSFTGNARLLAKILAEKSGSDILELIPEKDIPREGFLMYFLGGMSAVFGKKPKLQNKNFSCDEYDTVIIVSPVWGGFFAPAINTFIKKSNLKGKNIALVASTAGGDASKAFNKLKNKLPENKVTGEICFKDPLKMPKAEIEEKIQGWINNI